jgi:hypothetical protein
MIERHTPEAGDDTSTHAQEEAESPRVTARSIAITAVVLAVIGVVAMRNALPSVAASEVAPDGHFPGPCWACHTTSTGAR